MLWAILSVLFAVGFAVSATMVSVVKPPAFSVAPMPRLSNVMQR